MTYKTNDDYYSSPALRSFLQHLPQEPVKPIEKRAASANGGNKEPASFAEAILTLCNELRTQGFTSYAYTLEQKFSLLKQAENIADKAIVKEAERHLYNVHDETGNDFLEFAHPGGGNKELDRHWDDLGDVETIAERQKKIIEVLNKIPTKQSVQPKNAAKKPSIATIAKLILAQPMDSGITNIKKMFTDYNNRVDIAGGFGHWPGLTISYGFIRDLIYGYLDKASISIEDLGTIADRLQEIKDDYVPHIWNDKTKQDIMKLNPLLDNIKQAIATEQDNMRKQLEAPYGAKPPVAPGAAPAAAPAQPSANIDEVYTKGMNSIHLLLGILPQYEMKAGNDQQKLNMVHKTETVLITFMGEFQSLVMAVKAGLPFAQAVAQTTLFKSLTTQDQLLPDVNAFFDAAEKHINYMKTW